MVVMKHFNPNLGFVDPCRVTKEVAESYLNKKGYSFDKSTTVGRNHYDVYVNENGACIYVMEV